MILKGNARASGSDLATHLLNAYDNERVELAHIRGTIAEDLHGAFAEIEAIGSGTCAKKPLYSLSINPSEPLTREQYFEAIDAIETKLGLQGQPRAVVFHVKEGRMHAHAVWSRIDGLEMKAIHMAHDRRKLCDMACVLAEKFGHELPEGLKAWKDKQGFVKDKLEPTLAESAMADRTGISPEERRAEITAAYKAADSAASFVNALQDKGYVLAKGDRRSFVVVDQFGDVHSLSRYIKGVKSKEISARLGALDPAALPSVDQAKEQVAAHQKARAERSREQEKTANRADAGEENGTREKRSSAQKRAAMETRQAQRRFEFAKEAQALSARHEDETLSLHAAQLDDASGLLFRMRSKVADLIDTTPSLRSVLGHITAQVGLDPRERHKLEQQALARRHAREQKMMAGKKAALDKIAQRERQSLARDLKRDALLRMQQQEAARAQQSYGEDADLQTDRSLLEEGALGQEFNAEAQLEGDAGDDDNRDNGRKPRRSWKQRSRDKGVKRGQDRGRGYGYRRDD